MRENWTSVLARGEAELNRPSLHRSRRETSGDGPQGGRETLCRLWGLGAPGPWTLLIDLCTARGSEFMFGLLPVPSALALFAVALDVDVEGPAGNLIVCWH